MAEQDYGKHDPRNHARDCTFHLDQYAFECDCGATAAHEARAEHPQGGALYVQFAESPGVHGGECIRKWSRHPFEGALRFDCASPPTAKQ